VRKYSFFQKRKGGKNVKKIRVFFIFLLMCIYVCPESIYADHILSGQYKSETPKEADQLSDGEKEQLKEYQGQLNQMWSEYHQKVAEGATKYIKSKGWKFDIFTQAKALDAVIPSLETEYFGTKKGYFDGKISDLYQKIWNLGYVTHIPRFADGTFDSCVEKGEGDPIFGDGVCEGYPRSEYAFKSNEIYIKSMMPVEYLKAKSKQKEKTPYPFVIASEGMFTRSEIQEVGKCNITEISEKFEKNEGIPKPVIAGEDRISGMKPKNVIERAADKVGTAFAESMVNIIDGFDKHVLDGNCNTSSTSVLAQVLNLTKPVNVTNNRFVMAVTSISSQIALAGSIIIIAAFSLMYTTGFQNLDPVKFGIRIFFCITAINFLPYLCQDVLNLNNTIVHNVSHIELNFKEFKDDTGKKYETVTGDSVNILAGSFGGVFKNIIGEANQSQDLVLLFLIFVVLVVAVVPLLRLIFYWYFRMMKISIMVIVAPFMIMLMALPNTSNYGKSWMSRFVGETFSQTIVTLGFVMIGLFISNIGEIATINQFGWFGVVVFLLTSAFMLAELPTFSKTFFEGVSGFDSGGAVGGGKKMLSTSMYQGKQLGKGIMSAIKGKEGGNTVLGKAANKTMLGARNTGTGLGKGLVGKSLDQKSGLTTKLGHKTGGLVRNSVASALNGTKQGVAQGTELAKQGAKKISNAAQTVGLATALATNQLKNGAAQEGIKQVGNAITSGSGTTTTGDGKKIRNTTFSGSGAPPKVEVIQDGSEKKIKGKKPIQTLDVPLHSSSTDSSPKQSQFHNPEIKKFVQDYEQKHGLNQDKQSKQQTNGKGNNVSWKKPVENKKENHTSSPINPTLQNPIQHNNQKPPTVNQNRT